MSDEKIEPEVDEGEDTQLFKPLVMGDPERTQWRRETAIQLVVGLVKGQPNLLNRFDDVSMYRPANHLVAATRIVEMAAVIEQFVATGLTDDDTD